MFYKGVMIVSLMPLLADSNDRVSLGMEVDMREEFDDLRSTWFNE